MEYKMTIGEGVAGSYGPATVDVISEGQIIICMTFAEPVSAAAWILRGALVNAGRRSECDGPIPRPHATGGGAVRRG